MNKEEVLIAIKEIQCRYSLPALEQNYTDKDYACRQYEKLVIHLSNQKEKQQKELERYKNIIDKAIEYMNKEIELNNSALSNKEEYIISKHHLLEQSNMHLKNTINILKGD